MEKAAGKIVDVASAQKQIQQWKQEGKKIVFTNGCFDIIHLGHVDYLEKARALGD
ncbi:MAG TPA: D-glycero-beta-D-manno-heptose 1-phosphate adenylyltransferase, partial [Cytophagales bacterium]|nr:D-glycero-beta-D-manno-heptose 1-phosphate adenylyltransferase [Cytophagales bacterium]